MRTIAGATQAPSTFTTCAGPAGPGQQGETMDKYVCKICGWVYDPAEHDNVAFEALPDDWTCQVCGVGKDQFEKM
jgi:rubredoxin